LPAAVLAVSCRTQNSAILVTSGPRVLWAISLSFKRGCGAGRRSSGMQPAAFAFGMQRGVEDANNIDTLVRRFVHNDVGQMRDGEFIGSVRGMAALGEQSKGAVNDVVNAGDHRTGRGWVVARDVACNLLKVLQGFLAESDPHALRMPKWEKNS